MKKEKYDYILGCGVSLNILSFIAKKFNNINTKIIAWEHSQYDNCSKKMKLLRRAFYPKLDKIITLSSYDNKLFGVFCKDVYVIPNISSFKSNSVSNLRQKKVIAIGRLENEKGFDLLIKSFGIINRKFPDWNLYIYGEGSLRNYLNEIIIEKKLNNNIFLMGSTNNIKDKLIESSIMVLSSRSESFGMVIVEAMTCGLPVVSFDCKVGPREIISDSVDGFLVKPESIKELADKIMLLMSDFDTRVKLGKKAKIKSYKYSENNILELWKKILIKRSY